MTITSELQNDAASLAVLLKTENVRIVFAESCTAGLVSASLATVPGISNYHCGSAVVYRLGTKSVWLSIPQSVLEDPGAVSHEVAELMAIEVLQNTPEADLSASITGHLGPNAPDDQDGLIYIGLALRNHLRTRFPIPSGTSTSSNDGVLCAKVKRYVLPYSISEFSGTVRHARQILAAREVLQLVTQFLETATGNNSST